MISISRACTCSFNRRANYFLASTSSQFRKRQDHCRYLYKYQKNDFSESYSTPAAVSSASAVGGGGGGNILHHEFIIGGKVVSSDDFNHDHNRNERRQTVIFLHGLLGSGKNLRSPAKRLTQQYPNLKALLLDLRGHGQSSFASAKNINTLSSMDLDMDQGQKHTIQNCVLDIIETTKALNLTGFDHSPIGIIGHSFGGRCALQYTHALLHDTKIAAATNSTTSSTSSKIIAPPKCTWLLDTVPGKAHESVSNVIRALTEVDLSSIRSKSDLVKVLTTEQNIDKSIANWMTTNLRKTSGDQFEFMFDLDVAIDILDDFPKQNFMKMVKDCTSFSNTTRTYLVMAGRNNAWTNDIVSNLQDIDGLGLVALPKAGHWVHVDDLDGLMSLLDQSFMGLHKK